MRIALVTPARAGSRAGNRHTALRWAAMLRAAGHKVTVSTEWRVNDKDEVLLALHARRSHASIKSFRGAQHGRPTQRRVPVPGTRAGAGRRYERDSHCALAWLVDFGNPWTRKP